MTLKGIIKEFEERIKSIEVRQRRLIEKFEDIKPKIRKYEENKRSKEE